MKIYQTDEVRNLSLLGNAGLGKTTLAEAMLFEGGVINRRGDVGQKNTVSDYHEIEHDRQSSVFSTVLHTEWLGKKINIIDTPGHVDFSYEVSRSIAACEGALLVVDAAQRLLSLRQGALFTRIRASLSLQSLLLLDLPENGRRRRVRDQSRRRLRVNARRGRGACWRVSCPGTGWRHRQDERERRAAQLLQPLRECTLGVGSALARVGSPIRLRDRHSAAGAT